MVVKARIALAYMILGLTWLTRRHWWVQVVAWAQRNQKPLPPRWFCRECWSSGLLAMKPNQCPSCGADKIVDGTEVHLTPKGDAEGGI